jgi:uncharacterized lipoprotein NlpE involved in copper resistance/heat shock protein HslJ
MKKSQLLLFLLLIAFLSCEDKKKSIKEDTNTSAADFPKVNQNQDFIGAYRGILPCADCDGMETKIILNENNTYTKAVHYLGKGTKIFEQKGTFSWNKLGNIVILENISNAPNQYIVTKSKIIQLDMEGNLIASSFAKEYELSKQENQISDIGIAELQGDKVNLNNKLESSATIEQVNPAEGKFTLAKTEWKLQRLYGKNVNQIGNDIKYIKMNSGDGKFAAFGGCNQIFGSYAMPSVNKISFTEIGSTRKYCPGSMIESDYMNMLEETTSYKLASETLTFYSSTSAAIAIFVAVK